MSEPIAFEHGDGCGCVRCRGFEPGNQLATRHGCYSRLTLQPRAKTLREELGGLVPLASESDLPMLDLLAVTMAQVERAALHLAVVQAEDAARRELGDPPSDRAERLASDTRAWIGRAQSLMESLGLSPTSRAKLAGDLAAASREAGLARLAAEGRAIRERRERVVAAGG